MEKRIDIGAFLDSKDTFKKFEVCLYRGGAPQLEGVTAHSRELVVTYEPGKHDGHKDVEPLNVFLRRPGCTMSITGVKETTTINVGGEAIQVLTPGGAVEIPGHVEAGEPAEEDAPEEETATEEFE